MAEEFKQREEEERRLNEGVDDDDNDDEEGDKKEKETNPEKEKKEEGKKPQSVDEKEGKEPVSQPLKTKETVPGLDMVESKTRYFNDKKEGSSSAAAKPKEEHKEGERKREESASDEKSENLPESKKPKHLDSETKEAKVEEEKKESSPEKKKSGVLLPKFPDSLPRTLQEFVLLWKSYESEAELRARLLFLLPPERIPQFFKDSMTPAFLGEIISVLQEHGTKIDAQKTLGWMENLPGVGRFMMLQFGLKQKDKQSK